jgi:hypothetical protein
LMLCQDESTDFIRNFYDFIDLSVVVPSIAINNIRKGWITIDFDELCWNCQLRTSDSLVELITTVGGWHLCLIGELRSNVRARLVEPELASLEICQTRIQVLEGEYSKFRPLQQLRRSEE